MRVHVGSGKEMATQFQWLNFFVTPHSQIYIIFNLAVFSFMSLESDSLWSQRLSHSTDRLIGEMYVISHSIVSHPTDVLLVLCHFAKSLLSTSFRSSLRPYLSPAPICLSASHSVSLSTVPIRGTVGITLLLHHNYYPIKGVRVWESLSSLSPDNLTLLPS